MHSIYDILFAWIFCLFSDVLCIFTDDFTDFDSVVNCLKIWVIAEAELSLSKQIWLSIIIVKHSDEVSASSIYDLLKMQNIQFILNQEVLKNFYSFIKILSLADEQIFLLTHFWQLKKLLWRQMNKMQNVWLHYQCLYSAVHLNKFFHMTVSQTAVSVLQSFNFITVSWLGNEVSSDHIDYLTSFFWLEMDCSLSDNIIASFVTFSILLNAYSLKMHCRCSMSNFYESQADSELRL